MTALSGGTTVVERRRRQNLDGAKHAFINAVNEGVQKLIHRYGYSRERATSTLLRELSSGEIEQPDDEVFHFMKVQRVGMDEAARALTVSKAIKRVMKDREISAVEAIDELTAKLSLANFSIFSDDEVDEQIDELNTMQRPRTPTATNRMVTPSCSITDKQRSQPASSRKNSSTKKAAKIKTDTTAKGKTPVVVKSSRKRAMSGNEQDSINQGESKCRARADSVAEVVNAKMANVDPSAVEANKAVPARAKRRVPEDSKPAAAGPAVAKRPRVCEAEIAHSS